MRSSITNDIKIRVHTKNTEVKYRIFKAIQSSKVLLSSNQSLKSGSLILLDRYPHFKDRIRQRCVISGRGRGVYRKYKMSRIKVREYALQGQLACVQKRTW